MIASWAHFVFFVNLFWNLCKKVGPNCVSKPHFFLFFFTVYLDIEKIKKQKNRTIIGSFFEHFWEAFWGPFWAQIGHRGGKMSPREASAASKSQKAAFSKTLKNHHFFSVFGCRGSQENFKMPEKAPKRHPQRHPKMVQNLVKKWLKSEFKNEQTISISVVKISL